MDLIYLKKVLKIIEDADINEIEIEEGETKLKIVKKSPEQFQHGVPVSFTQQNPISYAPQATTPQPIIQEAKKPDEKKYHQVVSPIVGTFYKAPSPDAEPYVKVGQNVSVGSTLCIIEAMKLMNEIESDISGTIVKVSIENGQPVEYNQVLFEIEPN